MRTGLTIAALLYATLGTAASAAGRGDLQAACFSPESLRVSSGENRPRRHLKTFDKEPKRLPINEPPKPVDAALRGSIRSVALPPGDKSIALTFDLCEQRGEIAGYDGDIFTTLRRERVKATIFAGGKWMRSHATRTEQLISDPLFEIANHSETHRNLRLLSPADAEHEITAPEHDFRAARAELVANQCTASAASAVDDLPATLTLFRFPFGACNKTTLDAVNNSGYLAIQWSISSGDPDPRQSADGIIKTVLSRIKPGDIVVLHGNGRGWNTAKALPGLIEKLKKREFTFATVSELIARGEPVIAHTCYDSRPGDTDRYDHPWHLAGRKSKAAKKRSPAWSATRRSSKAPSKRRKK